MDKKLGDMVQEIQKTLSTLRAQDDMTIDQFSNRGNLYLNMYNHKEEIQRVLKYYIETLNNIRGETNQLEQRCDTDHYVRAK